VLAKKMGFICRQTAAPMGLVSIQFIDLVLPNCCPDGACSIQFIDLNQKDQQWIVDIFPSATFKIHTTNRIKSSTI
jgi:hypothetical protein